MKMRLLNLFLKATIKLDKHLHLYYFKRFLLIQQLYKVHRRLSVFFEVMKIDVFRSDGNSTVAKVCFGGTFKHDHDS